MEKQTNEQTKQKLNHLLHIQLDFPNSLKTARMRKERGGKRAEKKKRLLTLKIFLLATSFRDIF